MNKTERKAEIMEQLTAFNLEEYEKTEYFPELLKLQSQMSAITFNGTNTEARIWNIFDYLSDENNKNGNIADTELEKFRYDCKKFNNEIQKVVSGTKGENFTAGSLAKLKSKNVILRNVEIDVDGVHTEIDFLVFTKKAIFILEVKNSRSEILINEEGEYYTHGNIERFDCNIKEKMHQREEMITKILNDAGMLRTNIVSLLVFTNNKAQIENHCKNLEIAFLGQLANKIDRYNGWNMFSEDTIDEMAEVIDSARLEKKYIANFNSDIMKNHFAEVVATLEEYNSRPHGFIATIKSIFNFKTIHKTAA